MQERAATAATTTRAAGGGHGGAVAEAARAVATAAARAWIDIATKTVKSAQTCKREAANGGHELAGELADIGDSSRARAAAAARAAVAAAALATVVASGAGATVIWSDLYASASAYGQGRWRRAERLMLSASTAWQARGWSVAALVGVAESVAVEASEWLGRGSGRGE